MDEDQAEADCKSCGLAGSLLGVGGAEHYEDEDEGCNHLYEASAPRAAGIGYAVASKGAGEIGSCNHIGEEEEQGAGDDAADDLAAPVAASVFPAHASAEGYAEGDGGIDVAAGDFTDRVGHGHYGQTECDGGTYYSCGSGAAEEHCGSAAEEREHERADAFCKVLFHGDLDFNVTPR